MSKRNTVSVLVSAFALAMLCLLAVVTPAQKAPQSADGATMKNGVVKFFRLNAAPRVLPIKDDGTVEFGVLAKGEHYLIVQMSALQRSGLGDIQGQVSQVGSQASKNMDPKTGDSGILVTMIGTVDGPINMVWDINKNQAYKPTSDQSKVGIPPMYEDRISFKADGLHSITAAFRKKTQQEIDWSINHPIKNPTRITKP